MSEATAPPGPDGTDPFAANPENNWPPELYRATERWLLQVAPLIGLHGWRIYLSRHEAEPDMSASSQVRVDSDEAYVAVQRDHHQVDERRRRATLTHELLHCHLQPVLQPIVDVLEAHLPRTQWEHLRPVLRGGEERMIERLAWSISERLPPLE